jgi:hypothetical protein
VVMDLAPGGHLRPALTSPDAPHSMLVPATPSPLETSLPAHIQHVLVHRHSVCFTVPAYKHVLDVRRQGYFRDPYINLTCSNPALTLAQPCSNPDLTLFLPCSDPDPTLFQS